MRILRAMSEARISSLTCGGVLFSCADTSTAITNVAPAAIAAETGTGKELLARMIHRASTRSDGGTTVDRPFIAVNLAGLTDVARQAFPVRGV